MVLGNGRMTFSMKRLPNVLPLANREPEVSGEPVGHVQSDRLTAINKSLNAGSGDPCLPRQGLVADAAVDDCSSQNVGHTFGGLASAHGACTIAPRFSIVKRTFILSQDAESLV